MWSLGNAGFTGCADIAAGVYADLEEAMSFAKVKEKVVPSANRQGYDEIFEKYERVYQNVKNIYDA